MDRPPIFNQRITADPHESILVKDLPGIGCFTESDVEAEGNITLGDRKFSERVCGPITQAILKMIPADGPLRVDVRTHKLTEGEVPWPRRYWHTDFEFMHDSCPWMHENNLFTIHYLFVTSVPTEFVEQKHIKIHTRRQQLTWELLSNCIEARQLITFRAKTGMLLKYNSTELHRPMLYDGDETPYRYFFRATSFPKDDRRSLNVMNSYKKGFQRGFIRTRNSP